MNGVETSLYSAAFALCVFSAGLLRGKKNEGARQPVYFTAFLAIEALSFGCELLMAHPAAPWKCLWLGLRMALSVAIAPCLWLAIRESVEGERPKLRALGRWHWAAVAVGVTGVIPLWSVTHGGTDYPNPLQPVSWLYSKIIHTGMLGCIGIFAVQGPWYLTRSRRLLLAKAGAPRWLQWPLVVVLTTWLLGLLRTVQVVAHGPRELDLLFAAVEVSVTVGALYLVVGGGVSAAEEPEMPEPAEVPEPAAKYARSSLDAATVARIKRKLEAALGSVEVCGDSLLNLRSLSRTMGEKAHYVSQVINQELGTNFYELVNRRRIERAKRLLVEHREQTVLEIALAVGFNAKSTFNTAFRKETGMTPSAYRADAGAKRGTGAKSGAEAKSGE